MVKALVLSVIFVLVSPFALAQSSDLSSIEKEVAFGSLQAMLEYTLKIPSGSVAKLEGFIPLAFNEKCFVTFDRKNEIDGRTIIKIEVSGKASQFLITPEELVSDDSVLGLPNSVFVSEKNQGNFVKTLEMRQTQDQGSLWVMIYDHEARRAGQAPIEQCTLKLN